MPVTLSIQVIGAELKRKGLEDLRREIPIIGAQRIYEMLGRVAKKLRTPGKRVRYPINWDSLKQRIYVIAMLRRQGNLPYRRTGTAAKTWTIRRNPSSERVQAGYSLISSSPISRYLWGNAYGQGQSNIHKGRWPVLRDEMEKEVGRLPRTVEQHIGMVARRERLT